jgi:hypothetical protein
MNGARVELTAIDPHGASEAAANFEGGFDDGVAAEAQRNRLEIYDFPGPAAARPTRTFPSATMQS